MSDRNNGSTSRLSSVAFSDLWLYLVYIIQGLLFGFSNLVATAAIWRQEALRTRKEYVVIAGKSLADGFIGIAYLSAGSYYCYLRLTNQLASSVSLSSCFLRPHTVLFMIFWPMMYLIETAMSIDRFLATAFPLKYYKLKQPYGLRLAGFVLAICFLFGLVLPLAKVLLGGSVSSTSMMCRPAQVMGAVHPMFLLWYEDIAMGFTMAGLCLYVPIVVCYKKHTVVNASNGSNLLDQLKRQHKMTKSLAISALVTVLFWIIPNQLGFLLMLNGEGGLATACFVLSNMDPLFNVGILIKRQVEMRKALKALFKCHTLPPDIRLWQ